MVTHFFAYCSSLSFAVCRRLQFVKDTVCCLKVWLLYKISTLKINNNVIEYVPHISCLSFACIHSFIYSGHFYSASSSPLLLRGAPNYNTDTVLEFHAEAHRLLKVKDLPLRNG